MTKKLVYIWALIVFTQLSYAQDMNQMMKYRQEPKGDITYRKEGTLEGNRVRTLFQNQGEIAHWPYSPSCEWPKGSGINNIDGNCVLISTEIISPGGITIHPLETSYREWMNHDPVTGLLWGFEPIPGYADTASLSPALATDTRTWPNQWPRALPIDATWDGKWYGYFGKGIKSSDEETFFAMDDSKNGKWKRPPYNYFPITSDSAFGGIGLHVEVRGFQWSHVLAEDIIFWHYDIVNISDNDYQKTYFGFYTDVGSGGSTSGVDDAYYDKDLNIAYGWDDKGVMPTTGQKIGYTGWAYLESPGNSSDGIDNDNDGLIDEKRDSGPGTYISGPVDKSGVSKWHWSGDENGNWLPYSDIDGNGKWDPLTEPLNDDVGHDGLGPLDSGYPGVDEGEGDGIPTDGEPHFDKTDKDESDQIGLTGLSIYVLGEGGTGGGWPKDDESMWNKMSTPAFDTKIQQKNISMVFASGPFPLQQARRERFSMALVFGNDLQNLLFNKQTVQEVYNANYNFSKPPLKPTLHAVAGDRKVMLYWDAVAEQSRDSFLGYENNDPMQGFKKIFEGYLVYRSTDPEFNNIKTITDSKGDVKYWKPLAQFDLVDSISGPDPVGVNGASFWRGDNSGLQHSFIDTTALNGTTYYYAVVSYSKGDKDYGTKGLQPTECPKIISMDFAGTVNFVDINCAVVTPNAPVAGYLPPQIVGNLKKVSQGVGTGSINVSVLNPVEITEGTTYKVKFNSAGSLPDYVTTSYVIVRDRGGIIDTVATKVDSSLIGVGKFAPPVDGLIFSAINDTTTLADTANGWMNGGRSNLVMVVEPDPDKKYGVKWPCDYQIKFLGSKSVPSLSGNIPFDGPNVNFIVINTTRQDTVPVGVSDNDGNGVLSVGDDFFIVEYVDKNNNGQFDFAERQFAWKVTYRVRPNETPEEPLAGDVFRITTKKPFKQDDIFTFTTKASSVDNTLAGGQLDKISVVPNPYITVAAWEPRTLNQSGRGDRKIDFVHLPAKCTVRIYTLAGALVKTIEKDTGPDNGSVSWNLVSEDGMEIAYGVYIYHVDAPGIGEHVGKFAVIK
ncbi:MAG: hypothetical protein WCJ01_02890 [Ignavibacteria bacterium]